MSAIAAVVRCILRRTVRRSYSFYRLCSLSGAHGGSIHPTVLIGGRGNPFLGGGIQIGKHATLNCARGGVLDLGDGCLIGGAACVSVSSVGALRMAPGTSIGTHTTLWISSEWEMGSGSKIATHCEIGARESVEYPGRLVLGEGSAIGDHALIDLSGDLLLGYNVSIGPYAIIYTHNHQYQNGTDAAWKTPVEIGPIYIDDGAWIGAGVSILPGVRIGKMAVIAAGSVVVKDVPDHSVYGGVPARPLKVRDPLSA